MKKIKSKIISSKYFLYVVVPLLLCIYSVFSIIAHASPINITSISHHQKIEESNYHESTYLKKDIVWINIVRSRDNNLGIVSVKFKKNLNSDKNIDKILFELRENNTNKLLYQNVYRADMLYGLDYFPIGFPQLTDSRDKEYKLIFKSLTGTQKNAVMIDPKESVMLHYIYTKKDILNNSSALFNFLYKKLFFIFTDCENIWAIFYYFFPLLFYILFITSLKMTRNEYNYRELVILVVILSEIFLISGSHAGIQFSLLIIWIFLIFYDKMESTITFVCASIFLVICFFAQMIGTREITENSAAWCYYFLIIGSIQNIYEIKNSRVKYMSIESFFNKLVNKK